MARAGEKGGSHSVVCPLQGARGEFLHGTGACLDEGERRRRRRTLGWTVLCGRKRLGALRPSMGAHQDPGPPVPTAVAYLTLSRPLHRPFVRFPPFGTLLRRQSPAPFHSPPASQSPAARSLSLRFSAACAQHSRLDSHALAPRTAPRLDPVQAPRAIAQAQDHRALHPLLIEALRIKIEQRGPAFVQRTHARASPGSIRKGPGSP